MNPGGAEDIPPIGISLRVRRASVVRPSEIALARAGHPCYGPRVKTFIRSGRARFLWGWLALAAPARADVLWFEAGGRIELPADSRGEVVRVEAPGGALTFPREAFRTIVPTTAPAQEWPSRKRAAEAGGAPGRFEAAWWALEHGLIPEAVAMLRAAHQADAAHEPTARMVAALDRLAVPRPDPDLAPIRKTLGGSFEEARGPHVVLLHQHEPSEAAARVDLLERVATTFVLTMAAWGVDLPVPGRRLPSAWFARQEDYLAFLRADGGDAFRTTRGYYHPTLRLVIAYDARAGEPQRPAREALAIARLRLADAGGQPSGRLERLRGEVARRELLFDLDCRSIDVSTAAHEMIHQLVAATGLSPRPEALPVWLHEGLAMQFEVVRGGRWAGVGRVDDFRLPYWRQIDPPPRLAPLLRDLGFGRGYSPDRYAEAWALVYFLRKEHPREFVAFLDLLQAPDPEPSDRPGHGLRAFRAAFGEDLGPLEAEWRRFVDGLRLPGEP